MPFLGIFNCRNLWKIVYHLHLLRRIEKFRTNEMSVCRSCEPENGSDRLVISFSPFDGGMPDTETVLCLAETLGLDRSIDYEIISKPSFLCEKELVTYIIQTIPLPARRCS
jgi:hypothetical protein